MIVRETRTSQKLRFYKNGVLQAIHFFALWQNLVPYDPLQFTEI